MAQMEEKSEEKSAMMSIETPPPPPCYQQPTPKTAYLTKQQQLPDTLKITASQPQYQQQASQTTTRKRARRSRVPHSATWENHGWNQGGQTYYHQGGQHPGGYGVQGPGGPTPPRQQQKPQGTWEGVTQIQRKFTINFTTANHADII